MDHGIEQCLRIERESLSEVEGDIGVVVAARQPDEPGTKHHRRLEPRRVAQGGGTPEVPTSRPDVAPHECNLAEAHIDQRGSTGVADRREG